MLIAGLEPAWLFHPCDVVYPVVPWSYRSLNSAQNDAAGAADTMFCKAAGQILISLLIYVLFPLKPPAEALRKGRDGMLSKGFRNLSGKRWGSRVEKQLLRGSSYSGD